MGSYWARWQVAVCFLIFAGPAAIAVAVIRRFEGRPDRGFRVRADQLWVPCWTWMHPLWLLFFRATVFIFMSWLLYLIAVDAGAFSMFFYTQWTFLLVIIYFALATVISAYGYWCRSRQPLNEMEEANGFLDGENELTKKTVDDNVSGGPQRVSRVSESNKLSVEGILRYLVQITFQTSAGAVVLTDIVFWGLIVPFLTDEHFKLNLLMGCMHSLNLVFLLLDTAFSSLSFPLLRMAYFVLWSCVYVSFQWIIHACGFSWWPYPFLDLRSPWSPMWYFFMALVHVPCYGFYFLVVKAKETLFPKLFTRAYIKLHR